jgi:hypothetical protein
MIRRPSVRLVATTVTAAALIAGGVDLASYAASSRDHGAGASASSQAGQPKTLVFHLGKTGQSFNAGSIRLYSAKVPTGNYSVSMSGVFVDKAADESGDSYTCVLSDKKSLLHGLGSSNASFKRIYSATGQDASEGVFSFGVFTDTNPVAHVDRHKILFGCLFNGTGPYQVSRVPVFTLTPVKRDSRSGHRFTLPSPKADLRKLSRALR